MIRAALSLFIDRPPEEVFAFLTKPENHRSWDTLSIEMEQIEPGPWRAGMRFREVRRIGRRNVEIYSHVAAIEPSRRMDIESETGPPFKGYWRFEPEGAGTRLRYRAEMQLSGPMRLVEPLLTVAFRRQLRTNFTHLKRVLEAPAPQPS